MTGRLPSSRRPELCRWYGAECPHCQDPVTHVTLHDSAGGDTGRVAIDRKVHPLGTIAARVVGPQMHGYRIGPGRPLLSGYRLFREHLTVCTEAPPPPHEQPGLFDDTEGNQPT